MGAAARAKGSGWNGYEILSQVLPVSLTDSLLPCIQVLHLVHTQLLVKLNLFWQVNINGLKAKDDIRHC